MKTKYGLEVHAIPSLTMVERSAGNAGKVGKVHSEVHFGLKLKELRLVVPLTIRQALALSKELCAAVAEAQKREVKFIRQHGSSKVTYTERALTKTETALVRKALQKTRD